MALALAVLLCATAPAIGAEGEFHTNLGENIHHYGCNDIVRVAKVFYETAQGMEKMQEDQGLSVNHKPIRDYLRGNLKLDSVPDGTPEHTLFSGMVKFIMEEEDPETVGEKTRELCKREFRS